jgi:dTDP-glucose 4,6-dehydratase
LSGAPEIRLGSTAPVRDFNYVADTVEGFLAVAASPKSVGEHFNLGSGRGVTVGAAAKMILKLSGSSAKIVTDQARVRPEKSEVHKLICSSKKAARLLGWKPKATLEQGLSALVDYVRANRRDYKAGLYNL